MDVEEIRIYHNDIFVILKVIELFQNIVPTYWQIWDVAK